MTISQDQNQTTADPGTRIEILDTPAELDLTTADNLAAQGRAAISRRPGCCCST
jgi:hypothetical protein